MIDKKKLLKAINHDYENAQMHNIQQIRGKKRELFWYKEQPLRSFQFKLFAAFFNKIRNVFVPSDSRKFRSYAGKFWLNYVGAIKSMH